MFRSNSIPSCKRLCAKTGMSVTRRSRRCLPTSQSQGEIWKRKAPRQRHLSSAQIKRHKRGVLLAVAAAMLAAAALAYHFYFATPTSSPNEKSIAVLPFADLSQAHDQEYFCDGISEEILNSLARTEGLRVVARISSFSFKGRTVDVGAIAQKLGVRTILEGSVRRDGNRVRSPLSW